MTIGVAKKTIEDRLSFGLSVSLGQLYGVVIPGLIFAKHVFQGLKRPMYVGNNPEADGEKLAFAWSATEDARLVGSAQQFGIEFWPAPEGRVFTVYISPNRMLGEFPEIAGWVEHWTWLPSSPTLADAPIDWETRYERKLWSA